MYPTLPFGPLEMPTAPVLAILAVILTLDVGGRYARRIGIHPDDPPVPKLAGVPRCIFSNFEGYKRAMASGRS